MTGAAIAGWRGYALLASLCLILYVPGLWSIPPTDRDEARFAQATRQMLESGDFLRIRFQDEARNKKPAGIYWLQAASVAALSDAESIAIWPYRLPSVAGALLAVLLTFHFGTAWFGRQSAFLGATFLAASLGTTIEAHLAKTDAVLLATVVAAQGALGEIYRRSRAGERIGAGLPLLFWVAQGAGILVKGPIAPLTSLLTAVALAAAGREARWLRALRFSWGVPLAFLIAGPWLAAILLATDGAFAREAIGHDLLGKLLHGEEGHGAPPGAYLVLALVTFWPGSIALGAALRLGWRARRDVIVRFLLAWIVPLWLLLELVPTKLPHYILPVYPALALLSAQALRKAAVLAARPPWLDVAVMAVWSVVTLAFAAALVLVPLRIAGAPSLIGAAGAVLGLAFAMVFLADVWRGTAHAGAGALAAAVFWGCAFGAILPQLDALWLSRAAANLIADQGLKGRPVAAAGYGEPSLVFLLGTGTKFTTAEGAALEIATWPRKVALVSERDDAAFIDRVAETGAHVEAVGHVEGLNYSNGRHVTLTLYRTVPR